MTAVEESLLQSAREKVFQARAQRIRPQRDDKVLASWNGLMLGSVARASAVLAEPAYRGAAEKNLAFLQSKLWDAPTKTLYHRWRDGARDSAQLLEAYAFLLSGVLDLYQVTLQAAHLEFAIALAESMLTKLYDEHEGGFWQSAEGANDLILRISQRISVALVLLLGSLGTYLAITRGRPPFRQDDVRPLPG